MKTRLMIPSTAIIILILFLTAPALNAQNLNIRIDPAMQTAESGQTISVDVRVENADNLGAFQFDIVFDTNILHVNKAMMGVFLGSTGRTVIPVGPDINNGTNPGKVTFGGATLGANAGPNGNGVLASVEFSTQANGNTALELQNVQVSDINGQVMTINAITNGEITVGSVPVEMIVTNTNDSGEGSLRRVIEQANITPESDEIIFAIPTSDPGYDAANGIWRIKPASELPALSDAGMSIDGWSQEGIAGDVNPDGPEIVLDGSSIPGVASGLLIAADDISIYGLNIQYFKNAGILVSGANRAFINECLIGTDHRGLTAAGNNDGIVLINGARDALIGAEEENTGNVISGNSRFGVSLSGSSYNQISKNLIGINQTKTDTIGNHFAGISLEESSAGNQIINNFIGGNNDGVSIINSDSTEMIGNWIGTDNAFTLPFGNRSAGVYFWADSRYTEVVENVIGYNLAEGVSVGGANALYNRISKNSISKNGAGGIVTWSGGNLELAPPTILSYSNKTVQGQAQAVQTVEVFADEADEGRVYLGSVEADGAGRFSIELDQSPPYNNITATATDVNGNTSRFSAQWVITAVEENPLMKAPSGFMLQQNFPNPFNPSTTLAYHISGEGMVKLAVYDLGGRRAALLVNKRHTSGEYSLTWDASSFAGGIYFARLQTENEMRTIKMMLVR